MKILCVALLTLLSGCVYFPSKNTQIALICNRNINELIKDAVVEANYSDLKGTKCSKTEFLMMGVTW